MSEDSIEIYENGANKYMCRVNSSHRLMNGDKININKMTWIVVNVTFAIDHSTLQVHQLRCNVDVVKCDD